jgi:hypothetical protein
MNSIVSKLPTARFAFLALGLLGCVLVLPVSAQVNRESGDRNARLTELLEPEEAAARLMQMRALRMEGDFRFEFVLEHLPRRDKKTIHAGTMWGSSNAQGSINRIRMSPTLDNGALYSEFIVQSGLNASVWKRPSLEGSFKELTGAALFDPIIEGVLYTPFDLQMPFLYWNDFKYLAPTRALSRLAQEYEMYPPSGSIYEKRGITAVRIAIDDVYDALLEVEVIGAEGSVLTEFKVESLKKVDGTYIVNNIVLSDKLTRDRTRFSVEEAELGLSLDQETYFDPSQTVTDN